jgi:hypothetical protein
LSPASLSPPDIPSSFHSSSFLRRQDSGELRSPSSFDAAPQGASVLLPTPLSNVSSFPPPDDNSFPFQVPHDLPTASFRDLQEPGPLPIILSDSIPTSPTSAASECILAVVVFILGQSRVLCRGGTLPRLDGRTRSLALRHGTLSAALLLPGLTMQLSCFLAAVLPAQGPHPLRQIVACPLKLTALPEAIDGLNWLQLKELQQTTRKLPPVRLLLQAPLCHYW